MTTYRLDPAGPHSDDYTMHVAQAFDEAARVLNHATRDSDGVTDPATVNAILGSLRASAHRLDQMLLQLDARLTHFSDTGQLADTSGRDREAFEGARVLLVGARDAAVVLAARLDRAFDATSGLYLRDGSED